MRFPYVLLLALSLAAPGCQSQPGTPDMLSSSAAPERMRALARLAGQKRWDNIPTFIRFLDDPDVSVRWVAIQALTDQAGTDFLYRHTDPPEQRALAIGRWQTWWQLDGIRGPGNKPPSFDS